MKESVATGIQEMSSLYGGEIIFSDNPPKLILVCGPCRSGTTALSNIFATAGISSYMQPIKSARRAKEAGEEIIPWQIAEADVAVSKETLGPKTRAEFFNPVEILLNLGYPKEKLVLIPIVRDPVQLLASWRRMWGEAELQKFVDVFELVFDIEEMATADGVLTVPYAHEIIRDNNAKAVLEKLFERIDLTKQQLAVAMKNRWGHFKGSKNVFFYDDPPERFISGIEERKQYEYRNLIFSEEDRRLVESVPRLKIIYENFYKLCRDYLGL